MENTLKNNTVNTLAGFSAAYDGFHATVQKSIYADIIELTGWSRVTFYNKKNGVFKLRPLETAIIENIFFNRGVDAWTGETLEMKEYKLN